MTNPFETTLKAELSRLEEDRNTLLAGIEQGERLLYELDLMRQAEGDTPEARSRYSTLEREGESAMRRHRLQLARIEAAIREAREALDTVNFKRSLGLVR